MPSKFVIFGQNPTIPETKIKKKCLQGLYRSIYALQIHISLFYFIYAVRHKKHTYGFTGHIYGFTGHIDLRGKFFSK